MKISSFARFAMGACAATAIIAGCTNGGLQSQLSPSGLSHQSLPTLGAECVWAPAKPPKQEWPSAAHRPRQIVDGPRCQEERSPLHFRSGGWRRLRLLLSEEYG